MDSWPSRTYSFTLPLRYRFLGPEGKGLVITLHGYQDHAVSLLRRLGWLEQEPPFRVLAVNAPFPVPLHTKAGFMEAYSWYFRDSTRGYTVFSPQDSARHLAQLINDLGLSEQPTAIVGFSQGGYLAPFLASELKSVKSIIGIGCSYPLESYSHLPRFSVHGIHGENDDRVSLEKSQLSHADLIQSGFSGEFYVIPDLDHRVDIKIEPLVQALACECFK